MMLIFIEVYGNPSYCLSVYLSCGCLYDTMEIFQTRNFFSHSVRVTNSLKSLVQGRRESWEWGKVEFRELP